LTLIPFAAAAFLFVEAVYLYAQWEVAVTDRDLLARRWTDVLMGRPGRRISLTGPVGARVRSAGGIARQLLVEQDGRPAFEVSLILWRRPDVQLLTIERTNRGVEVVPPSNDSEMDAR
jgi:hypothetical protein